MKKFFKKFSPLLFVLVPNLYKFGMVLITSTCRVRWHNKEALEQATQSGKPWVTAIWHDNVSISAWALRGRNITVMVSDSRDGEYIARCVSKFGNNSVRGSTSKGSSRATRAILKLLKGGKPIAITPDGPRGPRYEMQTGALWLAALGKVPIIPFHIEASNQWVFNSWDKHKLPKPFSTIHIGVGTATYVNKDILNADAESVTAELEAVMMDNANQMKKNAGVSS